MQLAFSLSIKAALNMGIFVGALALTAAGLRPFTIPPTDPVIGAKLAWWNTHGADYDTLIIGTSRLYRGVIPRVLDETAAAEGMPLHSFNLAVDGLRPPEDDFVLEKALAVPGLKLRWVIVECNEVKLQVNDLEHQSARDIYWHDWPRLRILWRRTWARSDGERHSVFTRVARRGGNLEQFAGHVRLWLWSSLRPGGGIGAIGRYRDFRFRPRQSVAGRAFDGYDEPSATEPLHGRELNEYTKMWSRLLAEAPPLNFGDSESQAELGRKRGVIERVGAKMILVRPPYLDKEVYAPLPSLHRVPFFDCSDPSRFPQLYAVEVRRDYGHTNARGSAIYSRMLAHELHRIAIRDGGN